MRHGSCRCGLRWLILGLLVATPLRSQKAHAAENDEATESAPPTKLGVRAGYAFFGRGRSIALEHRLKPALRLDASWALVSDWELGAAARGVVTSSSNYGVWALTAQLRYTLIANESFALRAQLAVGAGYNAPILHSDLEAGFPIIPYVALALQPSFVLTDELELGIELESEQLSVLHVGALVSYAFR